MIKIIHTITIFKDIEVRNIWVDSKDICMIDEGAKQILFYKKTNLLPISDVKNIEEIIDILKYSRKKEK